MKTQFIILLFFMYLCLFVPSTAYAYLDPGTGNALVYVVLSLIGAFLYFVKGIYYKLRINKNEIKKGMNMEFQSSHEDSIVIFSEGKTYWTTYKPLVKALLKKKQPFTYLTMDISDPCLLIDNELMNNRYIGNGNFAYAKIGNLDANIVITTTPNIGTKGFPIPRSQRINNLIYTFHGLSDLAFLRRGSLDCYDTVMLVGEFEIDIIRKLEKLRNLPEKRLIPGGILYMDELLNNAENQSHVDSSHDLQSKYYTVNDLRNITVLLAPSYGAKGFLSHYGFGFIETLAMQGFQLIFRPHPQSFKEEKKLLLKIKERFKLYSNILWDTDPDATRSFKLADIMISDTSDVKIDFAFVYRKPFIVLPIPLHNLDDFEIVDLGGSWKEEALQGIGYQLKNNELDNLSEIIVDVLNKKKSDAIEAFINQHVYNWGYSSEVIADYLISVNHKVH